MIEAVLYNSQQTSSSHSAHLPFAATAPATSCSSEATGVAAMASHKRKASDHGLEQGPVSAQSLAGSHAQHGATKSPEVSSVAGEFGKDEASCSYLTKRQSADAGSDSKRDLQGNGNRAESLTEAHISQGISVPPLSRPGMANGNHQTNTAAIRHLAESDASARLRSLRPQGAQWYMGMRQTLQADTHWNEALENIVRAPFEYLASKPGKEVRGHLIEAMNFWFRVPDERLKIIHKSVAMLHTASLLIDDIEDASELRRGIPASHCVFGVPQTINSANYIYFVVYQLILEMHETDEGPSSALLIKVLNEEIINLHRGQGMELYWRDSLVCPTEEEYVGMVNNKTSGLMRIIVRLMACESPVCRGPAAQFSESDFLPLVNLIGLLFQIRDDYMNLRSGDYASIKGYCEDLHEGKFSFPVIHALAYEPDDAGCLQIRPIDMHLSKNSETPPVATPLEPIRDRQGLLHVLHAKPQDPDIKRTAVEYMDGVTGSFRYSCEVMLTLDKLVREEAADVESKVAAALAARESTHTSQSDDASATADCPGATDAKEQHNTRLWGILTSLRKGWYGGPDCPDLLEH